jgi:hypothetical protein
MDNHTNIKDLQILRTRVVAAMTKMTKTMRRMWQVLPERNLSRLNTLYLTCSITTPSLTSNSPWLLSLLLCPMACFNPGILHLNLRI